MKIHVAIVSEQILPNFIPALMERPDWVCLVASPQMSERGLDRRLARLLRQDEIAVEIRKGAPESGLADIHSFAYAQSFPIQK